MIPATITIDESAVEKLLFEEIQKKVQEASYNLRFVDAKKIAELCCVSTTFLEEHIFGDVRAKTVMLQKGRKRLWKADVIFDVIEEILSE